MSHRLVDEDLTARGLRDAEALAERLRPEQPAYAVLACSPLLPRPAYRRDPGSRLGSGIDLELEDLREVDVGDLDGRTDPDAWSIYRGSSRHGAAATSSPFPGRRGRDELAARLRRALAAVGPGRGPRRALVVAHGANLRAALPLLTGLPDPATDLATGGIARLTVTLGVPVEATSVELLRWGG